MTRRAGDRLELVEHSHASPRTISFCRPRPRASGAGALTVSEDGRTAYVPLRPYYNPSVLPIGVTRFPDGPIGGLDDPMARRVRQAHQELLQGERSDGEHAVRRGGDLPFSGSSRPPLAPAAALPAAALGQPTLRGKQHFTWRVSAPSPRRQPQHHEQLAPGRLLVGVSTAAVDEQHFLHAALAAPFAPRIDTPVVPPVVPTSCITPVGSAAPPVGSTPAEATPPDMLAANRAARERAAASAAAFAAAPAAASVAASAAAPAAAPAAALAAALAAELDTHGRDSKRAKRERGAPSQRAFAEPDAQLHQPPRSMPAVRLQGTHVQEAWAVDVHTGVLWQLSWSRLTDGSVRIEREVPLSTLALLPLPNADADTDTDADADADADAEADAVPWRVHVAVALEPFALAEKRRRATATGAGDDEAGGNAALARLAFRRETGEWVSADLHLPAVLQPWTLLSDAGANASLEAYHGPDAFGPSSVAAAGAESAAAAFDTSSHEVKTAQYRSLSADPPAKVRTQSGAGTTAAAGGLAAAGVCAVATDGGMAAADILVPTPDRRMVPHQDVAEAADGGGSEVALERSDMWRGLRGVFYCVARAPAVASAACGEAEEEDAAHRLPPADYSGWTFVLVELVTPPTAAAASASVTAEKARLRLRYVYGFASARAAAEARSQRRFARPRDFEHDAETCAVSATEAASPSSRASEVPASTALAAARPAQPPPHSPYRLELLRRACSDELVRRPTVRVPMTRERRGSTIAGKQRACAGGVPSLGAETAYEVHRSETAYTVHRSETSNVFDESEDEEGEQLRSAMTASCLSYEREQILRAQVAWTSNSGSSLEGSHLAPCLHSHSHPHPHPHPLPHPSPMPQPGRLGCGGRRRLDRRRHHFRG